MLAGLIMGLATVRAQTVSVPLVWDPSPDASTPGKILGYKLYYASHTLTDLVPGAAIPSDVVVINTGNLTTTTVSGLGPGVTYFFAVTAIDSQGIESDLSNVTSFQVPSGETSMPPAPTVDNPPPGPGPTTTNTSSTSTGTGSGTTSTTNTAASTGSTSGGNTSTNTTNELPVQANLVGLLPRLALGRNGASPVLTISGALGATLTVEAASGITGFEQWSTVTNIKMSKLAANFTVPEGGALIKAFQPSVESWTDTNSITGPRFYRIIMPHGYAVVADEVLRTNGYNTRLVAVRLADLDAQIACYVTEEGAYLHYDDETFFVSLQTSGATIREVADKLTSILQQNWTSASEFTIVEGLKQILATVVKTDPPSSDPPLGSSGGVSIAIDF
jgi:hypothetical protein